MLARVMGSWALPLFSALAFLSPLIKSEASCESMSYTLYNIWGKLERWGAAYGYARVSTADTSTATGRLMIAVLGGLADVERDLIRTRTSEGRERAKTRGVRLGRKPKLTSQQKHEALERRRTGETLMEIARSYNVSFATISRLRP